MYSSRSLGTKSRRRAQGLVQTGGGRWLKTSRCNGTKGAPPLGSLGRRAAKWLVEEDVDDDARHLRAGPASLLTTAN